MSVIARCSRAERCDIDFVTPCVTSERWEGYHALYGILHGIAAARNEWGAP